jgi:hypothetical protein
VSAFADAVESACALDCSGSFVEHDITDQTPKASWTPTLSRITG